MEPCVITIEGVEYDVTDFSPQHPGGADVLRNLNGKDATQAFLDTGHSKKALSILKELVLKKPQLQCANDVSPLIDGVKKEVRDVERSNKSSSLFSDKDVFLSIKHVHKILGFATLFSYCLVITGYFVPTPHAISSLLLVMPALSLALSSLIFHVPLKAPKSTKIHVEYRLHTIIFSLRSILIYLTHWVGIKTGALFVRLGIIIICHYCADVATRRYHQPENGTTIRADISEIPTYDRVAKLAPLVKLFASMSQMGAIYLLLFGGEVREGNWPMMTAFGVLIPVQTGAFLKTLVLKRKIPPVAISILYNLTLIAVWVCVMTIEICVFTTIMAIARFRLNANKYMMWTSIVAYDYFTYLG